jgi:hypothetical protein
MTTKEHSPELNHFLDLAKQGKHPGCSTGELGACELADRLAKYLPYLDGQATTGLAEFAQLCITHPGTARELIGR